jgi:class 3 adenylate cyclase
MIYAFGDCELDTRLYILRRADQVVRLRPKVFQMLRYLMEHRDRVVNKDELYQQVWPEQCISDATLESTLRNVRQVVGDNGRAQRIIQTLHGHGYRFVAHVVERNARPADAETQAVPAPPSPVTAPPAQSLSPAEGYPGPERTGTGAEHRHLTVLFCDLVDSTMLAGQLDPEDLREVVRDYHDVCTEVVRRFDGYIAQYLGDGLLIYFGYPQAHEDDARRAVYTGLGIIEAMQPLNAGLTPQQGVRLAVRLGIHTGLVVVGEIGGGGRQEQLALGDTPNIAARLQGLAEPDTVVVSGATYHLIEGYFACRNLGVQTFRGVTAPLQVYQVLRESETQTRLEVASLRGLTPLVGREHEVEMLCERWRQVKAGQGQVVVLSGEAGIGKSRLVQVVKEYAASEPHVRWECRGLPYHQHSALYPIIDLLQRTLQIQRDDTPLDKLRKLEDALAGYGVSLPKVVPLLASLLSTLLLDPTLSPEEQKQQTREALLTLLLTLAGRYPVLMIVEDLHWVDPSTLELLGFLIHQVPTARVGLLFTCRPEFRPPWGWHEYLTLLTLGRLPTTQAECMIERVAGGKTLPATVVEQIVAKTDGVPLFVEELTKMVLESEWFTSQADHTTVTGSAPPLAIPATLHDSLMARLDRLGIAKEVAQLGAVIGRRFSYELLQAVAPLDETVLQRALAQLVEVGLLHQRGLPPQATYLFKHALIQQAAYQALLRSTRRQHHRHIAQAMVAQFSEIAEMHPELLAYHYTEAALPDEALPYWQQAGLRALERSAYAEAIAHCTAGLEGLKSCPDTPERAHAERALQSALDTAVLALKRQSSTTDTAL